MATRHSSRRTQVLKKDTARQQKRRDNLKATGTPTTHVLNRAVAEGFFYHLDAERANGVPAPEMVISVKDVLVYATAVLSRRTNGIDQYDIDAIRSVLRKRIGALSASKFRMQPTWSVQRGDGDE